jgi:uncharacterized membrane protein YecN with MAPEG domain
MPVVSAFYAALAGLLCAALSLMVISHRFGKAISLGDGGDAVMSRAVRVFGNFAEYAPLIIVMLALAEMLGVSRTLLHVYGAAFVVGRILHAVGLYRTPKPNIFRFSGVTLTLVVLIGLAVALLLATLPKIS